MSVALTRSRCSNALRCYVSYALSRFGLVHISHMPTFISVEPAAICQLRCPECPVGQGDRTKMKDERLMSREVWERVLTETAKYAHTIQFYFQGEPLLNNDLPRMIQEAHEAGLYTIVSTNAQALRPEWAEALIRAGLSRIIISMDGLTQASYGAYRIGGDVERCKQALRLLQDAKQRHHARTTIEWQCLRLRSNEHEWAEMKRCYRSLGADRLTLKTAQLYDYTHGHPLMPSDARYSRYEQDKDGLFHRKHRSRGCLRVWSGCVITTGGEVLPCCYDKAHNHVYGNILNTPLRELFTNTKAQAFRRAAIHQQASICQECWK